MRPAEGAALSVCRPLAHDYAPRWRRPALPPKGPRENLKFLMYVNEMLGNLRQPEGALRPRLAEGGTAKAPFLALPPPRLRLTSQPLDEARNGPAGGTERGIPPRARPLFMTKNSLEESVERPEKRAVRAGSATSLRPSASHLGGKSRRPKAASAANPGVNSRRHRRPSRRLAERLSAQGARAHAAASAPRSVKSGLDVI